LIVSVVLAAVRTQNIIAVGEKAASKQQSATFVADEAVGVPLTPLERYELGTVYTYTQPDTPQLESWNHNVWHAAISPVLHFAAQGSYTQQTMCVAAMAAKRYAGPFWPLSVSDIQPL